MNKNKPWNIFQGQAFFLRWLFFLSFLSLPVFGVEQPDQDPIAAEIARWQTFLQTSTATDEDWKSIQGVTEPVLAKAEKSLKEGRRNYALHLLALARPYLATQQYMQEKPAESRKQMAELEQEWKRAGTKLMPALNQPPKFTTGSAVVRAVGQASFSEIKPYYEASIEYGRNTVADAGLYYIGSALAQLEMAELCLEWSKQNPGSESVRIQNLAGEIESFEDDLLAQYKPPASIDSHPIFIRTNAILKGARELQYAGDDFGALYRILDGRVRLAKITLAGKKMDLHEASKRGEEFKQKLSQDGKDHSIALLFIEMAVTEAAETAEAARGQETAYAIFENVLPHYFSAIAPPQTAAKPPAPEATVTLLRWPYS